LEEKLTNHFWVLGDFSMFAYGFIVININHWNILSIFIYIVPELIRIKREYPIIFYHFLYNTVIITPALAWYSYHKQKNSKNLFLQQKKIQSMNFEQKQIIKELPDGVIIHKKATEVDEMNPRELEKDQMGSALG